MAIIAIQGYHASCSSDCTSLLGFISFDIAFITHQKCHMGYRRQIRHARMHSLPGVIKAVAMAKCGGLEGFKQAISDGDLLEHKEREPSFAR
jgi:hypothetical protein